MKCLVTLLDEPQVQRSSLEALASDFGCNLQPAKDLNALSAFASEHEIVAVLFDARALGMTWSRALQCIREAAPDALPIVCHTSSEKVDWPELAEAGAFHVLLLPLHPSEVKQSLGFIADAQRRQPVNVVPFRRPGTSTHTRRPGPRSVAL
jgi:DNA-binding NtrC family response regulator